MTRPVSLPHNGRGFGPLAFRIYDAVAVAHRGGPDLSLLEMSRRFGVGYGNVRQTLRSMERRGIVQRIYQGIYRLPDLDAGELGPYIAAKDEFEGAKFENDHEAMQAAKRSMADAARGIRRKG